MNFYNQNKINNNMRITMKLKSILIAIVVVSLFLGGRLTTQAQGIYSADYPNDKNTENTESIKPNDGPLFRGIGDGGDERPADPDGDDDPIGEGILILSLLSGVYAAIIKRNVKRKHEY